MTDEKLDEFEDDLREVRFDTVKALHRFKDFLVPEAIPIVEDEFNFRFKLYGPRFQAKRERNHQKYLERMAKKATPDHQAKG